MKPIMTISNTCEAETRDKLISEIENKSKNCSNPSYLCSLPRLDGHEYCLRHILQDPRASYRQCTFVYSNNKKCPNAVPKHDVKKDPSLTMFCFEHSRKTQFLKTRMTIGKLRHATTNDVYLNNLQHHVLLQGEQQLQEQLQLEEPQQLKQLATVHAQNEQILNSTIEPPQKQQEEEEEEIDVVSPHVEPYEPCSNINRIENVMRGVRKRRRILDYASDSSSDEKEQINFLNSQRDHSMDDSDDNAADGQEEEYLSHAGVYTRQEVNNMMAQKLAKLQSLYLNEINRLHHLLRERRRVYLHEVRAERELHCSIHSQQKSSPAEYRLYQELKALNVYHQRRGTEAILYKKYLEKRSAVYADSYIPGPKNIALSKCNFTEGGVRCPEKSLPSSKYCRRHILEDKKQILFRACGIERSGIVCQEPVPIIFDDATCMLHLPMPQKRQYIQKKYESETEEEEAEVASVALPTKVKNMRGANKKSASASPSLPPPAAAPASIKMEEKSQAEAKVKIEVQD